MKKFALIILLALSTGAFAQTPKLGHINSNELLLAMPARATIETEIQNLAKELEARLIAMQRELETKYAEFQEQEPMMQPSIKESKIKELTDLEQRLKEFQVTAQEDLTNKEKELTEPLINEAKQAIEDVAKENGYTYILDSGIGFILYSQDSDDIMPLVKKKLGLE